MSSVVVFESRAQKVKCKRAPLEQNNKNFGKQADIFCFFHEK